jgi:hypothetical protein
VEKQIRAVSFAVLVVLVTCFGCSSGGDGGGDEGNGEISVAFLPSTSSPGAGSVSLSEGSTSGDLVTVDVNVTDMSDVFAADFQLEWNDSRARFLGWDEGNLLSKDGEASSFSVVESSGGILRIECTRVGTSAEVDAVGTERLLSIDFRVRRRGETPLSFSPPGASSPREITDAAGNPVSGNDWAGGRLFAG